MRSIAVINQKGGVGKTTITANLGHALALAGRRVTLVDLDPQGHLSASLGIFKPPARGIADLMQGDAKDLDGLAIHSRERLTLIPAGKGLSEIGELREGAADRAYLLRRCLQEHLRDQDFLLLDCPPSAGLLMANAVLGADEALIPVTGDYLGLNGLAQLMLTLKKFQRFRERPLRPWIQLSRFQTRRRLAREVERKLLDHFPGRVLPHPIQEAAVLAECPGVGRSIFEYRPRSRAAAEFKALAQDLIEEHTR